MIFRYENQFVNQLTVSTKLLRWVKVTEVYGAKTLPYPLVSPKHISQICMWKKRRLQGNELETWAQLVRASIGLSKLDNPMKRALTQIIKSRLLWMIAIEIKQRPVYSMPLRNHHTITHPFRWLIFYLFIIVSNFRVSGKKCQIMKHECVQNETKRIKCVQDVTNIQL